MPKYRKKPVVIDAHQWFMNGDHPVDVDVRRFEMQHKVFKGEPEKFSEIDAPDWLTSVNTVPGSTMDDRWFWKERILTLQVGESIETDFQTITRVA